MLFVVDIAEVSKKRITNSGRGKENKTILNKTTWRQTENEDNGTKQNIKEVNNTDIWEEIKQRSKALISISSLKLHKMEAAPDAK